MADDKKIETFFGGLKKLIVDHFGAQKFKETKLKDGTVIYYEGEMPVEGIEVWVIPSDGTENLPAPDGVHELEDGTKIEVVSGKIVKVQAVEAMEEKPAPASVPETEAAAKRVVESVIKETVYSKQEVTDLLKSVEDKFEAFKKETSETISTLKSENETLTKSLTEAKAKVELHGEKFAKFSAEVISHIDAFGKAPQVQEKEKQAEFQSTPKKVISDKEFKEKYMNK